MAELVLLGESGFAKWVPCPGIRHLPREFCTGERDVCKCNLAAIPPKTFDNAQRALLIFVGVESRKRKRPLTRAQARGETEEPSVKQQRYIDDLYKPNKKARTEKKKKVGKRKAKEMEKLGLALEAVTGVPRARGEPRFDPGQSFQWFNDIFNPGAAKANTLAGFLFRSLVGHTAREVTVKAEDEKQEDDGESKAIVVAAVAATEGKDEKTEKPTKEVHHNGYLQVMDLAQLALVCKELGGTGKNEKAGPCTKEIEVRFFARESRSGLSYNESVAFLNVLRLAHDDWHQYIATNLLKL